MKNHSKKYANFPSQTIINEWEWWNGRETVGIACHFAFGPNHTPNISNATFPKQPFIPKCIVCCDV